MGAKITVYCAKSRNGLDRLMRDRESGVLVSVLIVE